MFANGSGPAAREETNEVGRSWTGSLWSRTRRYWTLEARIGTSITVTARGPGHHYPCRGDTVDHRTARHVEPLVALYDNELGVTVVATAIASTALFLGSILAHEIARARSETLRIERSRCHAVRVWRGNRITSDIKRPCDEFALTIVGPWTSIVLGFGFGLGAFGASSARIGTFAEVDGQLGWLNVILGVFNLLPEVPLDGGHLPDATLWRITLNHSRATAKSTRAGQIIGALIIVFGLNELLFVTGSFIVGRSSCKRGFESRRVCRRADH